jgi:hypothetical protein
MTTKDRRIRDKGVSRFEVVDETGRLIVKYGVSVELLYQDDGKTLKVFLRITKCVILHNIQDVAQLGRALRLGRRCRWFESSYPDQIRK